MSFSDPPPPPSFLQPPFPGDGGCFWPQTYTSDEYQESNPQTDYPPPFKRPRNLEPNQSNFTPFQIPMMNNPTRVNKNPIPPPLLNKGTGHIFFKTRMCLKFLEGNCRNGESCTFAHGAEDLREPPPNWQEIVAKDRGLGNWNDDQRLIHKMKICKKFYNGEECPYGEKCNFLHIDSGENVIRIGTVGSGTGNRSGSDQVEINRNLNSNLGIDGLRGNSNMKPTYWKTRLCSKFEMTGHCPFGERCHFAHGDSDLQVPGARIEAEAVNALTFPTKPSVLGTDIPHINAVIAAPTKEDGEGKKCFSKWKGTKKINRIYADWIDDLTPPLSSPSQVES